MCKSIWVVIGVLVVGAMLWVAFKVKSELDEAKPSPVRLSQQAFNQLPIFPQSVTATGVSAPADYTDKSLKQESIEDLVNKIRQSRDRGEIGRYLRILRGKILQTEAEIKYAIKLLDDENVDVKCIAMEMLARIKEKGAVRKIIGLLEDRDDQVKVTAAMALGEIGDKRAIKPLMANPDLMALEFGVSPLAKFGAEALPELVDLAKEKSLLGLLPKQAEKSSRSRKAVYVIGQIRDEKAVPELMELLKDDDNDVKLGAVKALAAMNVKEAEPEFEKMLDNKNYEIRAITIKALVSGNREKYIHKAIEMLGDNFVVFDVTEILGKLKEQKAVPKLEELLKNSNDYTRYYAAKALWRITGKVYEYNKSKYIQSWDDNKKDMIKDKIKRGEGRKSLERYFSEQQREGFLWEYQTLDKILEEINMQGIK